MTLLGIIAFGIILVLLICMTVWLLTIDLKNKLLEQYCRIWAGPFILATVVWAIIFIGLILKYNNLL